MGIGSIVRHAFGRHERLVSEIYRRSFVDLDSLIASVRNHVNEPAEILEIGCGDGLLTERLALAFPAAEITGIDICAQPGRLYQASHRCVRFLRVTAEELAKEESKRYHLLIVGDVLHHVPHGEWPRFLASASLLVADGGTLVLKDWVREQTLAYWMGYISDRFITGDRIRYPYEGELRSLVQSSFGSESIRSEFRVKPWHCNLALVIRRA